ncbi:MmcQ/YjbR family DNA-binding protein [Treponema sp.]|uniref:MmcQ/YjbR family DNA-binding protein n=1 Tax=Treponema sp. TaxID=166 RepID=UPI00298E7539|nr:MmcQ/YjbR family DNA-binding protein [Treponema sp.]MCQ2241639.1 MmcQ/YjbR family DNA-binding protein [Treponema sp.]
MDYSYILSTSVLNEDRLLDYGFMNSADEGSVSGKIYTIKKEIPGEDFYAIIKVSSDSLSVTVYDGITEERYALFDAPRAHGKFIGELREKVRLMMEEIQSACFDSTDIKAKFVKSITEEYGCTEDFPWNDEASVFRCRNNKWFALLMRIRFKNVGLPSEEHVWAVNLKQNPEEIPGLIDNRRIFPAYHMNKKYWITVLVSGATDFDQLLELTRKSHDLVESKK